MKTIEEVKEFLVDAGAEDASVFDSPDDYAEAFVGVSDEGRAVYDYNKMIQCLMDRDGMSMEEAAEWIDYNVLRSLPYVDNPPIILYPVDE